MHRDAVATRWHGDNVAVHIFSGQPGTEGRTTMTFASFKKDASNWITLASGEYYPDILSDACALYGPVLKMFEKSLKTSATSVELLNNIAAVKQQWMRIQMARVFRKYVSPKTPVEMLKQKARVKAICKDFGKEFRPIAEVQAAFKERPMPDEALCAVLWEYKDRGKKGYDLTEKMFALFEQQFPGLTILGPKRAGSDVLLHTVLPDYPNPGRPVDFVIYDEDDEVMVVGLARYDSDRGGAQEDDRTGGYRDCAHEVLNYAANCKPPRKLKVVFVNDGPGLLLGSMWDDYARLEANAPDRIMVVTLRMIPTRLSLAWILS